MGNGFLTFKSICMGLQIDLMPNIGQSWDLFRSDWREGAVWFACVPPVTTLKPQKSDFRAADYFLLTSSPTILPAFR
jgi:hypothetical protein